MMGTSRTLDCEIFSIDPVVPVALLPISRRTEGCLNSFWTYKACDILLLDQQNLQILSDSSKSRTP